jgi:hypothetical protein
MSPKKAAAPITASAAKHRPLAFVIGAALVALAVNVVFFATYPINAGQSDNATFVSMIISGKSNLMHASGYPALVHVFAYKLLPLLPSVASLTQLPPDGWFSRL